MRPEEIQQFLKDLYNQVGAQREALINAVREQLSQQEKPLRKGEFAVIEEPLGNVPSELLSIADDLYLTSALLQRPPQTLNLWRRHQAAISELRKAMDTATSGEGAEWIPTGFSRELIDRVRLELKVANLHRRITMPTNPYKMPVLSADPTAYYVSESQEDESTKFKASQATTSNFEFNAKKLAVRIVFSEELTEDSIVPLLPHLKDLIVTAIKAGEEKAIIDGDTSASHQDSDVTDARDARKAWNGYRKLTQSGAKVDFSGTVNLANLHSIRESLTGVYAADPNKLVWITSVTGYLKMVRSVSEVLTVDKYGPQATVLTGELGKFMGSPIIVSEYVRNDLNASGVYDGITTSKTIVLLVNRDAFMIGDRRKVTVKVWSDPRTDQQELIITERVDFKSPFNTTANKVVGFGYNI
jgi:HK97 family phage major capsid protein